MNESILEMSKELTMAVIKVHQLGPEEARDLLGKTHAELLQLQRGEPGQLAAIPAAPGEATAVAVDWKKSIQRRSISCLECGAGFRQLSRKHLNTHDLNPRSYRHKYGMPLNQPLSAREVTARRKQLAKDIQPWIRAKETRLDAKQAAAKKAPRKRAAANA